MRKWSSYPAGVNRRDFITVSVLLHTARRPLRRILGFSAEDGQSMKRILTIAVGALLCALLLGISPLASAHEEGTLNFVAVEWQCHALPLVLRKQATNSQTFLFSNIGYRDLRYVIFAVDFHGKLAANMHASRRSGMIVSGETLSLTNTALQIRNVPIADEEAAEACFAGVSDFGGGSFGPPLSNVSVRELRRVGGSWVGFTSPPSERVWLVSRRASASGASEVDALIEQRRAQ